MRPNPVATLATVATIAVVAFAATACKSSSHASTPPPAQNPPATQTQADSASPESTSTPASASMSASTSVSAATAASSSAPPSASAPAAAAGGAINACSLLTGAQASALTGRQYGAGTASVIAPGQDACTYPYSGPSIDLTLVVYEPTSGVSWTIMQSVLGGQGTVMQVSGVGDKAMFAGIELDVATGKYLFNVKGAGALNEDAGAIAIAKEVVGALGSH